MSTRWLAVDTTTDWLSIALGEGAQVLFEHHAAAPQAQAGLLKSATNSLLAELEWSPASLDGLVVGVGPGSFTGVRLGVAFIQGIALGLDCEVCGLSSLRAIADAVFVDQLQSKPTDLLAVTDARMGELYAGLYRCEGAGLCTVLADEVVCAPEKLVEAVPSLQVGSGIVVGNALNVFGETLATALPQWSGRWPEAVPHASALLRLAAAPSATWQAADCLEPLYLRNRVALTTAERAVTRP